MTKSEKKHASKNTLALLLIALPGITYLIINNYSYHWNLYCVQKVQLCKRNLGKPVVWTG